MTTNFLYHPSSRSAFNASSLPLLHDNLNDMEIVDVRSLYHLQNTQTSQTSSAKTNNQSSQVVEPLPEKIIGSYSEDYNILYLDDIIRKKLAQEKTQINRLKNQYQQLAQTIEQAQTYLARKQNVTEMEKIQREIEQIETGQKMHQYESSVEELLAAYRQYSGQIKTLSLETEKTSVVDEDTRDRIYIIESYLEIARQYISLNIVRNFRPAAEVCLGCGESLKKIPVNEEGTIRCPHCLTEHNAVIKTKLAKDNVRINTSTNKEDESIENFLKAFMRYQGLQEAPAESLYIELDEYFARCGRPLGAEIRELELNEKGRRGDTDHRMLWSALAAIGRSGHYEDVNLIGHIYWGWLLPDVMKYQETIILHYHKTQKVFHQIPPELRERTSSLGTQYRLWRHLQLVGHKCEMDEFRIAEQADSVRNHDRLWRLMCEGANDPEIYFIT